MFKNRLIIGGTLLWSALWLPSFAISETKQTYQIPWSVLNEGGKTEEATSTSYKLKDAIGQPLIGTCESASYKAYIGFWNPRPLGIVGVEEKFVESGTLPLVYSLSQNYPNPFNSLTAISYSIAKLAVGGRSSAVSLKVYDLTGRLIRTLVDEPQEPGYYKVSWDGEDDSGKRIAPGVYFYKLITGEYRFTKKMVILR
jgi:hypothetical protein